MKYDKEYKSVFFSFLLISQVSFAGIPVWYGINGELNYNFVDEMVLFQLSQNHQLFATHEVSIDQQSMLAINPDVIFDNNIYNENIVIYHNHDSTLVFEDKNNAFYFHYELKEGYFKVTEIFIERKNNKIPYLRMRILLKLGFSIPVKHLSTSAQNQLLRDSYNQEDDSHKKSHHNQRKIIGHRRFPCGEKANPGPGGLDRVFGYYDRVPLKHN